MKQETSNKKSRRRLAVAVAAAAAGATPAMPAAAQLSAGRPAFTEPERAELVQFRDFFQSPFGGNRGQNAPYAPNNQFNPFSPPRQPQVYESTKAPPPRKVETPPTSTVLVIGDAFADWLGSGLEEAFADSPEIGIV